MRKQNGITLISLVVTIIVVFILAAILISLMIGQEGILKRTTQSVEKTREENAKNDVIIAWTNTDTKYWEILQENSELDTREEYIEKHIKDYLPGAKIESDGKGGIIVEYQPQGDDKNYEFTIDNDGKVTLVEPGSRITLASQITAENYGDKVTNYFASNDESIEWKIFYNDGENVFLIASNYVSMATVIGEDSVLKDVISADYTTFNNSITGKKIYTSPHGVCWKNIPSALSEIDRQDMLFGITDNSYNLNENYNNSKCVSTLLDTSLWKEFKDKNAYGKYVIGGPTIEMWMKSWNEKIGESFKIENGEYGYYVGTAEGSLKEESEEASDTITGFFQLFNKNNSLYFPKHTTVMGYWLASPSAFNQDTNPVANYLMVAAYNQASSITAKPYDTYSSGTGIKIGIRPVVCLSSKVQGTQNQNGNWILSK